MQKIKVVKFLFGTLKISSFPSLSFYLDFFSVSLSLCLSRKKLSLLFNLYVSFLTLSFIFIFFQKMGHSHPLCSLFSSFQLQLTGHVQYKFLPMTGFEHQTSGAGSDRSTNWATTAAKIFSYLYLSLSLCLIIISCSLNL